MEELLVKIEQADRRTTPPDFRVGDIVRVHQRIREGGKERIQVFEGIVLARKHGLGMSGTFTVRRTASGVGVERIFPLHSPAIAKIERIRSSKVRRAKLYFLRNLSGKKAKLKGWEAYAAWEEPAQATEDGGQKDNKTKRAVESETKEATANDVAEKTDGESGGTAGDGNAPKEGASDPGAKS